MDDQAGYVLGRLGRPFIAHVELVGLIGVVATWNLGLGPRWYPISLVVLAIPQCWAGGRIYEMFME